MPLGKHEAMRPKTPPTTRLRHRVGKCGIADDPASLVLFKCLRHDSGNRLPANILSPGKPQCLSIIGKECPINLLSGMDKHKPLIAGIPCPILNVLVAIHDQPCERLLYR